MPGTFLLPQIGKQTEKQVIRAVGKRKPLKLCKQGFRFRSIRQYHGDRNHRFGGVIIQTDARQMGRPRSVQCGSSQQKTHRLHQRQIGRQRGRQAVNSQQDTERQRDQPDCRKQDAAHPVGMDFLWIAVKQVKSHMPFPLRIRLLGAMQHIACHLTFCDPRALCNPRHNLPVVRPGFPLHPQVNA